jgi:carboxyl-terminal processing protease
MKKTWIIGLFIAGIVVGALSINALAFFSAQKNPWLLASTSVDVQQIIQNISDSIRNKNLTLTKDRYGQLEQILKILESHYYYQEKIDESKMLQAAIRAMVDAIEDPYTVYLDNKEYEWLQQDLKWMADVEGIGAVVTKKDYYILIEEVLKESPAMKAGIRPLDRILAVDWESTKDETVNEAVMRIRWPKWSTVTITIERIDGTNDSREIIDIEVTRDTISIPSVSSEVVNINNKNIAIITISMIGEETEKLLRREITWLEKENIQGIILDLRSNGWWILPVAVEVASHFIEKWKIITKTKYQIYPEEIFVSLWYNDLSDKEIVVLIDGLTASAWEIIALALREQIGATIIGTQSFGKWSIQTLHELSNKDSLKYTIGRWYGPSWSTIDKEGIMPDIVIEFNPELYIEERIDNQLEEAKKILQTKLR